MLVRDATIDDGPSIWLFVRQIAAAGETFSWGRDITEDEARDGWFRWLKDRRGCTVVAVAADGVITGTAETGPDHGGPAAHVASASFMVDPDYTRRGATITEGFAHPVHGHVGLHIMYRRL